MMSVLFSVFAALSYASPQPPPFGFKAKQLLVLSDADMVATAYVDGKLGPQAGNDSLTLIDFSSGYEKSSQSKVEVSNSVVGPPAALTVSPDGKFAYVLETNSPRPTGVPNPTFKDLLPGNKLTVVDLQDPKGLRVLETKTIGTKPDSIAMNHEGTLLAINFHPSSDKHETPLAIIPVRKGTLGEPTYLPVPSLPKGSHLITVQFHPKLDLLATLNETNAELTFYDVRKKRGSVAIERNGNTIQVGKSPYLVKFTPDGKQVVVNNLYWGDDVEGRAVMAPQGNIVSVQLNAGKYPDGSPRHSLVSQAPTGIGPEGLAISLDGRFVVTTNLERSFLPFTDHRMTRFSSLSLFSLHPTTGALTHLFDHHFEGILPEAAVFDESGDFLAVTSFDHFSSSAGQGSVLFFRLVHTAGGSISAMVQTREEIPVTRGAHTMVLVRQ